MSAVAPTMTSVVVLRDVDWATYQNLRNADGNRNLRMTYDRGSLEIMSPSKLHERVAEILGRLVLAWTEERRIPIQSCGSTTLKTEAGRRGLEPDKCFYIQHEGVVREREEHDPAIDPPPDLAIEVDVTSSSRLRMPILAELGIRELWRWQDERLDVFVLDATGRYVQCNDSAVLAGFPFCEAVALLRQRHSVDETALLGGFRELLRKLN